jgi:type VI secretion system protein ImpG
MNNQFLSYYHQELLKLQNDAGQFARTNPHVAHNLELSNSGVSMDPHVSRLLESFSYLTARLQYQIDSQLPDMAHRLLETLYPALTRFIPSMSIVSFDPDHSKGKPTTTIHIPKHTTLVSFHDGEQFKYQTIYPVTVHPMTIESMGVVSLAQSYDIETPKNIKTPWYMCVRIKSDHFQSFLSNLNSWVLTLSMDIHGALKFHESMLMGDSPLYYSLDLQNAYPIPHGTLSAFGLDHPMTGGIGKSSKTPMESFERVYQHLQDFFNFPEKFMTVNVGGMHTIPVTDEKIIDILIPLHNEQFAHDIQSIPQPWLKMGCTPIVNLFKEPMDPVLLDYKAIDYPISANWSKDKHLEIYSIDDLNYLKNDDSVPVYPYYNLNHHQQNHDFFYVSKNYAHPQYNGLQMRLSFSDLALNPNTMEKTIFGTVICANRDVLESPNPVFQTESNQSVGTIRSLIPFTKPVHSSTSMESGWQLISHLSLDHMPIDNVDYIKELLFLYNEMATTKPHFFQTENLKSITLTPITRRMGDQIWRGFVDGLEIQLDIAQPQEGSFLAAMVLNELFSSHVSSTAFVEVVLMNQGKELHRWKPRSGHITLL